MDPLLNEQMTTTNMWAQDLVDDLRKENENLLKLLQYHFTIMEKDGCKEGWLHKNTKLALEKK